MVHDPRRGWKQQTRQGAPRPLLPPPPGRQTLGLITGVRKAAVHLFLFLLFIHSLMPPGSRWGLGHEAVPPPEPLQAQLLVGGR